MTMTDLQFVAALGQLSIRLVAVTAGLMAGCGAVILVRNCLASRRENTASASR